jgi:hypothetical protein
MIAAISCVYAAVGDGIGVDGGLLLASNYLLVRAH